MNSNLRLLLDDLRDGRLAPISDADAASAALPARRGPAPATPPSGRRALGAQLVQQQAARVEQLEAHVAALELELGCERAARAAAEARQVLTPTSLTAVTEAIASAVDDAVEEALEPIFPSEAYEDMTAEQRDTARFLDRVVHTTPAAIQQAMRAQVADFGMCTHCADLPPAAEETSDT